MAIAVLQFGSIYGRHYEGTRATGLAKDYNMKTIPKKYIKDENNKTVAVQVDIETYRKIEQVLEDYALGKLIEENDPSDYLAVEAAKEYYRSELKKE